MVVLLVLIVFFMPPFVYSQDVDWYVEVGDQNGNGYIVQIGDHYYVKTSSHITLGRENINLRTSAGKTLTVIAGKGVISNENDDQLIRIAETDLQPLGIYSPDVKTFVLPRQSEEEWNRLNNKISIERGGRRSYLTPAWLGRSTSDESSLNLTSSSWTSQRNPFNSEDNLTRLSADGSTLISDSSVVRRESGSPSVSSDNSFLVRVPTDLNGKPIDVRSTTIQDGYDPEAMIAREGQAYGAMQVPIFSIIDGQASSFNRSMRQSGFTANISTAPQMVQALQEEKFGNRDNVSWNVQAWTGGEPIIYRSLETEEGPIIEVNFIEAVAGDPITGNGGDPVTGNGGDPVTGNGGDPVTGNGGDPVTGNGGDPVTGNGGDQAVSSGTEMDATAGMIYHGEQVEAFILTESGERKVLYADWNNMLVVRQALQRNGDDVTVQTVSSGAGIAALIEQKLTNSTQGSAVSTCHITTIKDQKGVRFKIEMAGIESFIVDPSAPDYFVIRKVRNIFGKEMNLDIRGLYSVDLDSLSNQSTPFASSLAFSTEVFENYNAQTEVNNRNLVPYITIGGDDQRVESHACFSKMSTDDQAINQREISVSSFDKDSFEGENLASRSEPQ